MFYFCFDKYSLVIIKRIIENFLYKKRCIKHLKKQLKLKQLCLWGASLYIEEFLSKYKIKTPNIIGIIDTNPERCGKTFANYKIFSPNQIKDIKPKYILLTIKNNHKQRYVDIQNFLKENNSNIILLPNIFEGEPIYD